MLASSTYTHNIIYGIPSTINFVAWTLEIEVQFYLLAPFLSRVFAIEHFMLRRFLILSGMLVIPGVLCFAGVKMELNIAGHIQYFLAGFLLADFFLWSWSDATPSSIWCDVLLPVLVAGVVFLDDWHDPKPLLALPFLVFLFCYCAFCGKLARRVFGNIWIATIGGMCYTIYLYHELIIFIIGPVILRITVSSLTIYANIALQCFVVVPIILSICAVLFALFERPFMKRDWYRKLPFFRNSSENEPRGAS